MDYIDVKPDTESRILDTGYWILDKNEFKRKFFCFRQ